MITYEKLFEILQHEGLTQYKLCTQLHIIGHATYTKLKKNQSVTTETLNTLCNYLQVDLFDIITYTPDEKI